uniref:Alpha-1,6-mannosyl-glycoprotein 2-beta-N-acetylglucosaminyltransferase n=1 Tax=Parascaris equorum TaxID=6256 RepID=A0A914S4R9_PAREQ
MARYELGDAWVVLLEEDHYVAPDFLHVLKLIIENKKKFCEACQVISLGFYLKQYRSYQDDITLLGVHPWFSSKHNMGMAFDASTWQLIKNCSREFCTYDDYNWDWSLMHISMKCLPSKLRVIAVKAPRVLHAQDLFLRVSERLFPSSLRVVENSRRMLKPSKENGGWGDLRDHELCLNNSRTASLRHPLDFRNGFAFEANATNVSHPIIFSL